MMLSLLVGGRHVYAQHVCRSRRPLPALLDEERMASLLMHAGLHSAGFVMTAEQGAHMEVASLLERHSECISEDPLGPPPLSAKRVASLGDMVSGTTSVFPGELPGKCLRWEDADVRKPVLAYIISGACSHQCTICLQSGWSTSGGTLPVAKAIRQG